mgnify:CR=1 FL=1
MAKLSSKCPFEMSERPSLSYMTLRETHILSLSLLCVANVRSKSPVLFMFSYVFWSEKRLCFCLEHTLPLLACCSVSLPWPLHQSGFLRHTPRTEPFLHAFSTASLQKKAFKFPPHICIQVHLHHLKVFLLHHILCSVFI